MKPSDDKDSGKNLSGTLFTAKELAIGARLKLGLPTSTVGLFIAGKDLAEVYDLLSVRDRRELFPTFVQTFVPTVDAKTVVRWKACYLAFRSIIPELDKIEIEGVFLEQIELRALWALSKESVTDDVRKAAIALAKAGTTVTEEIAQSLVKSSTSKERTTRRRLNHLEIVLPSGYVHIAAEHKDFKQSLQEALTLVDDA